MSEIIIPQYTKEDFLLTSIPFEWLYSYNNDGLLMGQLGNVLRENAIEVGVKNFPTLFKKYLSLIATKNKAISDESNSQSNFPESKQVYNSGKWICDSTGVRSYDRFGNEIEACNHPLLVDRRLVAIDTNVERLKLNYYKGNRWRSLIADKKTLASSTSIIQLADYGLAVNSENSKNLVRFISDFENLNYNIIPEFKSINRCGWIDNIGFSPYIGDVIFDGEDNYKQMFDSITSSGSEEVWFNLAREVRKTGSVPARIILASSFASILVEMCSGLPFFVHLWGDTGTGKTVGLMLAASVWANPAVTKHYIRTFDSTAVGQEMMAGFVNNLPLILDELQLARDAKGQDKGIYKLAEGSGKTRGSKTGGLQRTLSWKNCILTSGEEPITTSHSDGGAINRTIEINCGENKLFDDIRGVFEILEKNYGFAGKIFVEKMMLQENVDHAKYIQSLVNKELCKRGDGLNKTSEKQNLAASLILTADQLLDYLIFEDGGSLTYDDLTPFLSTLNEVSSGHRGLLWISGWLAQNSHKFIDAEFATELWGKKTETQIVIIGTVFDKVCAENGFNSQSFLHWLARNGHIEAGTDSLKKPQRIGSQTTRCVCLNRKSLEN